MSDGDRVLPGEAESTLDRESLRDPTPVRPPPTQRRLVGRADPPGRDRRAPGRGGLLPGVVLAGVVDGSVRRGARAVDAIVVMGAAQYDGRPSPQLAARLDHAVSLWNDGLAPMVIVTGGNQEGDRFTEASTSAAYLVERGVPSSAIVQEDAGSTTHDSLDRARASGRRVRRDRPGRHRSVPRPALEAHGRGGRIHGVRLPGTGLGRRRSDRVATGTRRGRRCRRRSDHRVRTVEWPHRLRPIQSRPAPVDDPSATVTPWGVV